MADINVSTDIDTFLRSANTATARTNLGIALTQSGSAALAQTGNFTLTLNGTGNATITFPSSSQTVATLAGVETLTNKTLTSAALTTPVIGSAGASFTGSVSGTTVLRAAGTASGTVTIPTGTDTLVTLTGTQTLTNKTFVGPALGAASCTTINSLAISSTGGSLVLDSELRITSGHDIEFVTSAATSVTLPVSGTLYGTGASTITSAQLRSSMTDETGTGSLVFATSPTLVTPVLGAATGTSVALSGAVTADTGTFATALALTVGTFNAPSIQVQTGIYMSDGDSVSQATSKSTSVTLNKTTGQITMNAANLADATNVKFTVSNSTVPTVANIIINHVSGGTAGAYQVWATNFVAGTSFDVSLRNVSGGALAESPVLQFMIFEGSNTP